MGTGVRDKYHVALNGKGYMLRGAPGNPAYSRSILPSQINRLAVSDLAYSDFAGQGLFYIAQTDWSAGIKNERLWRDDGKYYYSTNIDAFSDQGQISLTKSCALAVAIAQEVDITAGINCSVAGTFASYIGTDENPSTGKGIVYELIGSDSWNDISSTSFGTNNNVIDQLLGHKDNLWCLTWGGATTFVVSYWNDSTWTDVTAAIASVVTGGSVKVGCAACEVNGVLYVGLKDAGGGSKVFIVSTSDGGSTFSSEVELNANDVILDMIGYGSYLYYLLYNSGVITLKIFDPATNADSIITTFKGTSPRNDYGLAGRLLFVLNGKLVITIPANDIWEYDGSTLGRIYNTNTTKYNIGMEAYPYLAGGGAMKDNRIYWGNLVYDGEYFFNYSKNLDDENNKFFYPIFTNSSNNFYFHSDYLNSYKRLWLESSSVYKSGTDQNFLIMSEMSPITALDKILSSIAVVYSVADVGESIKIQYSIDNMTTWTTIGSLTYAADGSTTKKTFSIPGNVIFSKIWFKIFLNGDGTSTPELLDFVMAYRPMPEYKSGWSMRLNFSESVLLLNRQTEQREGYELLAQLWNEKLVKQRMVLEDIDYVETSLTGNMSATATSAAIANGSRLPRQGRIRAVSGTVAEEMYYTSAYQKSIKGITRGAHGTVARAYASGQIVDNGYYVYIEDIKTDINFTDEQKTESIAQVTLIEA